MGFVMGGPLGALLGFFIGSLIDKPSQNMDNGGGYSNNDNSPEAQRNSFLFSLLVLASYIIRADKRIYKSEKMYVQQFLLQNFGEQGAQQGMAILEELLHKEMDINAICRQIADNMPYEHRRVLFMFLIGIARADGNVAPEEITALRVVAARLMLLQQDIESMLNLGEESLESAYKVLEVEQSVSDAELRAAYKRLVLKYHPDRVATLGADVQKAAEENLKKVNAAYDRIKKARGIS